MMRQYRCLISINGKEKNGNCCWHILWRQEATTTIFLFFILFCSMNVCQKLCSVLSATCFPKKRWNFTWVSIFIIFLISVPLMLLWLWLNKHTKTMTIRRSFSSHAIFEKLVNEIHYWFLLSALYLNKKVNRSANEMLFCLAFCELFPSLNSNQQLNNNEISRSFALWFLSLLILSHWGLFKNFYFQFRQQEERKLLKARLKVNGKFPRFMIFKLTILLKLHFTFYLMQSSLYSTTCGSNGIFSRRLDFSLYNVLPKQRINSIEVKVIMKISFISLEKVKNYKLLQLCRKKFWKTFATSFFFPFN